MQAGATEQLFFQEHLIYIVKMGFEFWSDKDVELLREHYPFKTNVELVKLLGKSERSISAKAQRLKVKRDWRFRQQILKEAKNRSL